MGKRISYVSRKEPAISHELLDQGDLLDTLKKALPERPC